MVRSRIILLVLRLEVKSVSENCVQNRVSKILRERLNGCFVAIFKWVRGELIGEGTRGKVYLALNSNTGEMISVRQMEIPRTDIDMSDSRLVSAVEALKLLSETLKDLDHPNIIQYLGFEETPLFLNMCVPLLTKDFSKTTLICIVGV